MASPAAEEPAKTYWYPERQNISLREVKTGFSLFDGLNLTFAYVVLPLVAVGFYFYRQSEFHLFAVLSELEGHNKYLDTLRVVAAIMSVYWWAFLGAVTFIYWWARRPYPVYLVDFATFDGEEKDKVPHDIFMRNTRLSGFFDEESVAFQEKLLYRTGLGNDTYFPPGVLATPPVLTMKGARDEAHMVLTAIVGEVLAKTSVRPEDIDILVVNCSLFNPTPSLAAMIVNHFKMRSDIESYSLSGMGCSAGVISIHLAKQLLQTNPNSLALVVSTENITQNWYLGKEKGMLMSNTLFRVGGAAMLLSNRSRDRYRAKFQLLHTVRVCKAADDTAYNSVFQDEDAEGKRGVRLSKELLSVVGDALKSNLTVLGPLVLPISEVVKFFFVVMRRKFGAKVKSYVPDFRKAFDHYCIHAGGRAVIDGLQENLKLSAEDVEPSRATLYRYGNTSSSSIWYEMRYIENAGRLKAGHIIWQIAFGSGFKCNSAVWKALRNGKDAAKANEAKAEFEQRQRK